VNRPCIKRIHRRQIHLPGTYSATDQPRHRRRMTHRCMSTENRTTPSWTVNGVVPSATAAPTRASGKITTLRNIHGTTSCCMNIPGWAGGCTQRHLLRRPSARGYDPRSASRLRSHTKAPTTTLYFVALWRAAMDADHEWIHTTPRAIQHSRDTLAATSSTIATS
jgi:hypothetical protein